MLIEPADDPAHRKVAFTWTNPDPARPPRDVLVRLQTLTDKAWADGDLSTSLLASDGNGTWRTTLEFRVDLRVSYRFYVDFNGILRGVMPGEEQWYGDMRAGTFVDPLNPRTFPGLATRPPSSLLELPDAPPQPCS